MVSIMSNAAWPSCNEGNGAGIGTGIGARTGTGTGVRTKDDTEGLEGMEDKVDIITSNKTNKSPILVSY